MTRKTYNKIILTQHKWTEFTPQNEIVITLHTKFTTVLPITRFKWQLIFKHKSTTPHYKAIHALVKESYKNTPNYEFMTASNSKVMTIHIVIVWIPGLKIMKE